VVGAEAAEERIVIGETNATKPRVVYLFPTISRLGGKRVGSILIVAPAEMGKRYSRTFPD
jgi:hypothetical protein